MIQGRLSLRDGDLAEARRLAHRAVVLAKIWALPSQIVMALGSLAEVELVAGDLPAARSAIAAARELIETEPIWPFVQRDLAEVEVRVGRGAARKARRPGVLVEQLTDRELSILRMLPGTASQREIGSALFLSINTVKGYAKSLYRKLDVTTRQEAVERGRALSLI
jgi:LuxR family maltose regulon positive regulatory protein